MMMKRMLIFSGVILLSLQTGFAQSTIAEARAMPLGTTVTVKGVVTNGAELGTIKYLQDATAGIAAYSFSMTSVKRGDSIEVTGVLKNYNYLLELDPVNSFTVLAENTPLPAPQVVTPNQMNESYEAELVRMNGVLFSNAGSTFAGNTNYTITAGGESAQIRINNSSSLVGEIIPSGEVDIIGICSQFSYTSSSSGYQLLLRDTEDILSGSSIHIISPVTQSNITTTDFILSWETDIDGTTELYYGFTQNLELGHVSAPGTGTSHSMDLASLSPSDLVYVKVFSVTGQDTAFGPVRPFITESVSTGDFKIYFTASVDHSVSTGVDAIFLDACADDTIIQYINRAKYTVDVAIYNFTIEGISNIATALNAAYARGVTVRVVTDGSTGNSGIPELTGGIKKIARPAGDGIMHDKFMIIDGKSTVPNDPIVWTGSCNWTEWNINTDDNNMLFIQDMSLAKVYMLEFEEMWGSTTATPDPAKAKFGIDKTDNTPHELIIGGKRVEVWFSPSDGVNSVIIDHINKSNNDIGVMTMLITRTDIGDALVARANIGINTRVVIDNEGTSGTAVVETLKTSLGDKFREFGEQGTLHSKSMIVDQSNPSSDPFILTGSHNWSSSADQKNDENTLVIHDAGITNLYYQEFSERYKNGIPVNQQTILNLGPDQEVCAGIEVILDAGNFMTYNWSTGDLGQTATIDSSGVGIGTKMVWCRVSDQYGYQWDTVYITFKDCSAVPEEQESVSRVKIFPNPSNGQFTLSFQSREQGIVLFELTSFDGRKVQSVERMITMGENTIRFNQTGLPAGVYMLRMRSGDRSVIRKVVVSQ
ncbi:MAG: T9SS type A sorting domain-containing protein [Bacteroidales bacterium]|nr:T9SS type A sorting domain-containing protein [Bacteroidales bacterium]